MPYITQFARLKLDRLLDCMKDLLGSESMRNGLSPGELNYLVTKLLLMHLDVFSKRDLVNADYAQYNVVVGVLECVKQEFYRRWVAGYEDMKREVHGDILE